jgi:hypothetical protein
MAISYFDSLIEGTSAIADAVFSKWFTFRWNGQRCELTAILSAHPIVTDPADADEATSTHSHNFEINAADLMFGGVVTEPQAGMEIEEKMADGSRNVYEVRPRDKARAFDPLDAEATRLLVYANYFLNETV